MDGQIEKSLRAVRSLDELTRLEQNVERLGALTDEVRSAILTKTAELGRALVAEKTGLDLSDLSPAEEKIVRAVSEYAGIQKRRGLSTTRTFSQLKNRGLLAAAEISVMKSKPTQGFKALSEEDLADHSYEQIIVNHPEEFSARAQWFARRTLGLPNDGTTPPAPGASRMQEGTATKVRAWANGLAASGTDRSDPAPEEPTSEQTGRNPPWVRDELILALDLYLRHRTSPPSKSSEEVAALSELLGRLASTQNANDAETFRNVNGVYMKMMNFRRFDPEYTANGKVGLSRGNKLEEVVWNEFANDPTALAAAVADVRDRIRAAPSAAAPYWVFVCNPQKWAIDRFLDRNIEHDTWGVRPSDRERFAPGQLGIVRVGVDRRSAAERESRPPLEPGIYALCEVESDAFDGTGASDEFWTKGEERAPGWPTVRVRYLRNYLHRPLTIERLRAEAPGISSQLLDGFQASSFPLSADDFHTIVRMLGVNVAEAVANVDDAIEAKNAPTALQKKYLHASPEVKERVSRYIERGSTGNRVKKERGFKCQICQAHGRDPIAFIKSNGEPYAEAHHVMPVSELQVGSLASSNIMVLCANHHRQLHYGDVSVRIEEYTFDLTIDGTEVSVPRMLP